MTRALPRWAVALALLPLPAGVGAQEIRGMATDAEGQPLTGTVVALHRVGGGTGASVASTTTDEQGRFRFALEAPDSAVYFAAMRYRDRMYIGPAVHAGFRSVDDYLLRADPASEAGAVASALAGGGMGAAPPAPATGTGPGGTAAAESAVLRAVALLGLAIAAGMLATVPRYRRRRTREALVDVAVIENRLAEGPSGAERDELVRRRDRIRERLAPRS